MNEKVIKLMTELKELKKDSSVLLVGGAVRDIILGNEPKDYDIATNIPMNLIEENFKTFDIGKNKDFGIVVVNYENESFEIAQFRKDGVYSDNRRPDSVEIVSNFKEDADRRDFTINAIALTLCGQVIDFHDGYEDLKNGIIRTVGNPDKRFKEDALRMLRAIRFAVQLDFDIDNETKHSIFKNAYLLHRISKERITEELKKMASTKYFDIALELMEELGILIHILPDVNFYNLCPHTPEHHPEGNVWEHTLKCIEIANSNDWLLNFSLLFHDIGKSETYELKDGKHTYHGHDKVGLDVFDDILKNELVLDNESSETIKFCIKNHMKIHKVHEMKKSKLVKLMIDKNWEYLKLVSFYDGACRDLNYIDEKWKEFNKIFDTINLNFVKNDEYKKIRKYVSGFKIMKWLNIEPSPKVGEVIDKTIEWIVDNKIDYDKKDGTVKRFVKENF